jgi:ABC-type dipeptide/oligopeptide/nickel transport system ATPase subunit
MDVVVLGVDLGKNVCSVVGLDASGAVVMRRKVRWETLVALAEKLAPCVVGMEACCGAHHPGRVFAAHGHDVRLMSPEYVRPYVKAQKNDDRDAEGIAEAATRPTMRFIELKSQDQLDMQTLHRSRDRLVGERTALINQLRAILWERGLVAPQGKRKLEQFLSALMDEQGGAGLSPRMILLVADARTQWAELAGRAGPIAVVNDVSFTLGAGQSLVLAGESGSGKSMICHALRGIVPRDGMVTGKRVDWRGRDLIRMSEPEWRAIRGAEIAMIFQDPTAALNPVITVEHQIIDVIRAHRQCAAPEARARAIEVLGLAGFPEPEDRIKSYPPEPSGGLRQRVAIALALACEPSLLITDEATTNLDVSIQAQVVRLLLSFKDELGLALIFVTHDLGLA